MHEKHIQKTVLVTGATGYVGRRLTESLLENASCSVRLLVRNPAKVQAGIAHRVRTLGIPGEFGQSAYTAEELYVKHGLTGPKMAEAALALIQG